MSDLAFFDPAQLKTLIEINGRLHSNYSDKDALLVCILESAMRLVHCEVASLFIVRKEDEKLCFVATLGSKGAEVKNILVDRNGSAGWVAENNKPLVLNNNTASDARFSSVNDRMGCVTRNMIAVPMRVKGNCAGVIELINKSDARAFTAVDAMILELLSNQAGIAYMNADSYQSAKKQISILSSKIANGSEYHSFVAESPAVLDLLRIVDEVTKTNTTVLITGESGVGKELFAEQIHIRSNRKDRPFARVNCATVPSSLLESELFGCAENASVNAACDRIGKLESCNGGTLFLDEVGGLSLDMQSKILRIFQEHTFERAGSNEAVVVDVRIIASTNRNLEQMVHDGLFRSDLYYRLNVVPLAVPPLRERKEDIGVLASFFLDKFSAETKKNFTGFSQSALRILYEYYWPGNIRELENSIERGCVLGTPPLVQAEDLRIHIPSVPSEEKYASSEYADMADEVFDDGDRTLKSAVTKFKTAYIKRVLTETSWNQTKAGKILGIQRTYVSRLLNELHIR